MSAAIAFECDEDCLVVEWERSDGSTRLLDVIPGDTLELFPSEARLFCDGSTIELTVTRFEDWGEDKGGWYVKFVYPHANERQHLILVAQMLAGWPGVWVSACGTEGRQAV